MSSTFTITFYRKNPSGGFQEVTLTIDQNLLIQQESSRTLDKYSVQAGYRLFSNSLVNGSAVVRKGVDEEHAANLKGILAQTTVRAADGSVTSVQAVPTAAAVRGIAILTGTPNPCTTPRCLEIRAAFEQEKAAAGGDDCVPCALGRIVAKYQKLLLDEGITRDPNA